jgi:hypothetical protein
MSTGDFIVIGVIVLILALAIFKIVKDKKRGVKCPGCDACCDKPRKH